MNMKFLQIFLLPFIFGFPGKKLITTAVVGSMLALQPVKGENDYLPVLQINTEVSSAVRIITDKNNIYLYGGITPESCEMLKNQLNEMNYNGKIFKTTYNSEPPPINLHIQSGGGALMPTFYIVDLIESMETPVHTYVDGYAASAASLISVVGQKRFMSKNSMILIHQLSSGSKGKYNEIEDDKQNMDLMMRKLREIYMRKTLIPLSKLNDILSRDLWMDAETCKKLGLVDEII